MVLFKSYKIHQPAPFFNLDFPLCATSNTRPQRVPSVVYGPLQHVESSKG